MPIGRATERVSLRCLMGVFVMDNEKWLPVVGYEKYYEVSSLGRVRRLEGSVKTKRKDGFKLTVKQKILTPTIGNKGYLKVSLTVNNKTKTPSVHSLVAKSFIKKESHHQCVNHKNGIKVDNRVENLEWCTFSENVRHSFDVLNRDVYKSAMCGAENGMSKPVICDTTGIVYSNIREASDLTGCSKTSISKIVNGHINSCKGLRFSTLPPSPTC